MLEVIRKLVNRDYNFSSEEEYNVIIKLCCLVHTTLIAIFWILHVLPLVIFNICSVILYIILVQTTKMKYYIPTLILAYMEIVVHTALSTVLLGNQFGFQLYVLAIIPISFYVIYMMNSRGSLRRPIFISMISFIVFFASQMYTFYHQPIYNHIGNTAKSFLYLYNSLIVFIMLVLFSLFFIIQIRESLNKIERQNRELNEVANTDPLTGLLNRRKFTKNINELVEQGKSFCVLLSDIDDFKKINDTYGHDCGDDVLIHVSNIYKNIFSNPEYVCRWGGEEFIVIYEGQENEGMAVAELLRATVANSNMSYPDKTLSVTLTTGVSYFNGTETIDRVIIQADDALYQGKKSGKNQVNAY